MKHENDISGVFLSLVLTIESLTDFELKLIEDIIFKQRKKNSHFREKYELTSRKYWQTFSKENKLHLLRNYFSGWTLAELSLFRCLLNIKTVRDMNPQSDKEFAVMFKLLE